MNIPEICPICFKHAWNLNDLYGGYVCDGCKRWFCDKHCLVRKNGQLVHENGQLFDILNDSVDKYVVEVCKNYMLCSKCRQIKHDE